MGKRHKRRRMVNKIAPHKGPVFLAKPVHLPTSAELMAAIRMPPITPMDAERINRLTPPR